MHFRCIKEIKKDRITNDGSSIKSRIKTRYNYILKIISQYHYRLTSFTLPTSSVSSAIVLPIPPRPFHQSDSFVLPALFVPISPPPLLPPVPARRACPRSTRIQIWAALPHGRYVFVDRMLQVVVRQEVLFSQTLCHHLQIPLPTVQQTLPETTDTLSSPPGTAPHSPTDAP